MSTPGTDGRRKDKKTALFLGLAALLVGALLFIFSGQLVGQEHQQGGDTKEQLRVLTVSTAELKKESSYLRQRFYLGRVETRRSSSLGFEIGGAIKKIHVREGQNVGKGSLLAELDTVRLEAAKKESEAQLIEAEALLRLAKATLERTRQAQKLKAVSIQQLDEAVSSLDSQRARVARVEAQVNRINVDLGKARLYAPYDGTIAQRKNDEGTVIGAGQSILEITETAKNEIRIGIDRDLFATLDMDQPLRGVVQKKPLDLQIERILPGRQMATRVVEVIAVPLDTSIVLREEDLVEVVIEQQIDDPGYWLPVSALTENSRGLWSCMVAVTLKPEEQESGATHRLVRRDVEIVSLEKEKVFVSSLFLPGDQLVVAGVHRVVPNQRVKVQAEVEHADGRSLSGENHSEG